MTSWPEGAGDPVLVSDAQLAWLGETLDRKLGPGNRTELERVLRRRGCRSGRRERLW